LAADIRATLSIDPELIEGGGGVFDVSVDGRRVFSKHDAGRFPENDEILDLLRG